MGTSISGGMIVGCVAGDLGLPDDYDDYENLDEFLEEHGMESLSPHYDADITDKLIGFLVDDIKIKDIDNWYYEVKELGEKFRILTGVSATLYGSQHIT